MPGDDTQPADGGQGGGEATGSPYDSYLNAVPEPAREAAEQWFRDTSKGLDAKLQEAADLKKTWEPYTPVQEALAPFRDNPEQLSELIAWWQQVTADDGAYRDWLTNAAREAGLTLEQEQALEDAEVQGELTREEVQQLVQRTAEERLGPLEERQNAIEGEALLNTEHAAIEQEIQRLQTDLGVVFSKDDKAAIFELGMPFAQDAQGKDLPMGDASWVAKGLERWKEIGAAAQRAFVEDKNNQPKAAVTAGGSEAFKPVTSFEDAKEALRERLRQQS